MFRDIRESFKKAVDKNMVKMRIKWGVQKIMMALKRTIKRFYGSSDID